MPTATWPMPDHGHTTVWGARRIRVLPAGSRPRASSTRSRYGGDRIHVKKIELTRSAADARAGLHRIDRHCWRWEHSIWHQLRAKEERSIMTHLIALVVALAFALGAGTTPAWAQATTPPAAKQAPVDINSASPAELKAVKGIGEADAKKIVENRPYKSTDELVQKKVMRSEEHTSELQSHHDLVCRLL